MEQDFENHKHLVWFKSIKECLYLLDYYLKHDDEREKIAQQGRELLLNKHTWGHRMKTYKNILMKENKIKRTHPSFFNHPNYNPKIWLPRIEILSDYLNKLPNIKFVYDFGCGPCSLEERLKNKKYFGYDLHQIKDTVTQIDFNQDAFPVNFEGDKNNRILICSGFLEYIKDKESLIKNNYMLYTYTSASAHKISKTPIDSIHHVDNTNKLIAKYFKVTFLQNVFKDNTHIYFAEKF
jgi:hypothetical protein